MRKRCGTKGRRRWCAACCHVVAGCATLFCSLLRFVTYRCVVLRRIVLGRVVSYGCVVVLCRGVFCFVFCCVVLGGAVLCPVVLFHVTLCAVSWPVVVLRGVVCLFVELGCPLFRDFVLHRLLWSCVALRRVV